MPSCTKVRAAPPAAPRPCPVSQPDSKGAVGRAHKALGEERMKIVYDLYEHVLKLQALGPDHGLASQPCCSPSCVPELFPFGPGCGESPGGCSAGGRRVLQPAAPQRCGERERRAVSVGDVGSVPSSLRAHTSRPAPRAVWQQVCAVRAPRKPCRSRRVPAAQGTGRAPRVPLPRRPRLWGWVSAPAQLCAGPSRGRGAGWDNSGKPGVRGLRPWPLFGRALPPPPATRAREPGSCRTGDGFTGCLFASGCYFRGQAPNTATCRDRPDSSSGDPAPGVVPKRCSQPGAAGAGAGCCGL